MRTYARKVNDMLILAIESSCDETAASVCKDGREVLSDVIYSQADMHREYGGVVPEIASRRHVEKVSLVAEQALKKADVGMRQLDAVAATCGPGLIGALLVGSHFAKGCAMALRVPFIPVHHIRGHIAANYVAFPSLKPEFIALVASGGHTLIAHVRDYTQMEELGGTRDDAAGEAFDKISRVMGLGYPGGAMLDRLGQGGDETAYPLPKAVIDGAPFDFSFSGLKTAAVNLLHNAQQKGTEIDKADLAASIARAVSDAITPRVLAAAKERNVKKIVIAGGVAANTTLRRSLKSACEQENIELFLPPLSLCGDNGAMIASQAYYEYLAGYVSGLGQNCYANFPIGQPIRDCMPD